MQCIYSVDTPQSPTNHSGKSYTQLAVASPVVNALLLIERTFNIMVSQLPRSTKYVTDLTHIHTQHGGIKLAQCMLSGHAEH
jgi:hypothetical protein